MMKRLDCIAVLAAAVFTGACKGSDSVAVVVPGDSVVVVDEVSVPSNYGQHDQFIRAGLAFLCSWNTGLQIYDVGDGRAGGSPAHPVKISNIVTATNGVAGGAQVHNAWWYWAPGGAKKYVFVGQEGTAVGGIGAGSSGDIHVVDVSDMANPVEVAFYHMNGIGGPSDSAGTHNFWVDETNQILYAAYYNGGVVALNIAGTLSGNLAAREIARIRPGGQFGTYVWGVQLASNGSLYASDMLAGLWQLKLNGNAFTVQAGGNNVPARFTSDLSVANGYAYTGTWGSGGGRKTGNVLNVWRLGTSGAPALIDSIVTAGIGTVSDVKVSDDNRMLMFGAEGGSVPGIYFYSLVADPGHPVFLHYYPVSGGTQGIHTVRFYESGGHRYVYAARDPGAPSLLILDVTAINP